MASGFREGDEGAQGYRKRKVTEVGGWRPVGLGPMARPEQTGPLGWEEHSIPDTFSILHFAPRTMQSSGCQ